ncbi:hypothetical protein VST7929_01015 [Vibrio stylophorae]|uniref:ATP-binding protein n=1 Tax=Vibrio stylophorae TaxID=659351 RepID=A0ABN8DPP1_9VIBR|nr:AAA family ATPase [Vibrio stylophorae]CAH0533154.1 hypothetical protein VST7929_01015 [Vibrio stylophorae]
MNLPQQCQQILPILRRADPLPLNVLWAKMQPWLAQLHPTFTGTPEPTSLHIARWQACEQMLLTQCDSTDDCGLIRLALLLRLPFSLCRGVDFAARNYYALRLPMLGLPLLQQQQLLGLISFVHLGRHAWQRHQRQIVQAAQIEVPLHWLAPLSAFDNAKPLSLRPKHAQSMTDISVKDTSAKDTATKTASQLRDGFYISCGISGSGKSTWIENQYPQATRISLDLIREEIHGDRRQQGEFERVFALAQTRLQQALLNDDIVIWDATNLRIAHRQHLYQMAQQAKRATTLMLFQLPLHQIAQQNQTRIYAVPEQVWQRQVMQIQWPLYNEAPSTQIIGSTVHNARHQILWQSEPVNEPK